MRKLFGDRRVRFLFVGGYNTVFGYATFALAYWLYGESVHYVFLVVPCHFLAVSHSYLTQRVLVFHSRSPWLAEYLRFNLAYLVMLPIGIGLLAIFHDILGFHLLVAQALGLFVVVIFSYVTSSQFTFRAKAPDEHVDGHQRVR